MTHAYPPRVGVEIGGTFTDLVWRRADGRLATHKVLSTPEEAHRAVLTAIAEAGVDLDDVPRFVHGSTIATNTLLTRTGARVGLLTTRGCRDVLEIGSHDRVGDIYEIRYRKPKLPIARSMIAEVDERIDAAGRVAIPLDLEAAWTETRRLLDRGAEALAIVFLHAYAHPQHELALAALIAERAPDVPVFRSSEVSPEFREFERSLTTVANAFVGKKVERYLTGLERETRRRGFDGKLMVMQSSGGVAPAHAAGREAVRMLLSGPAAGIRGAMWFAARNGVTNALTFDMGGTSTDVALAPDLDPAMISELTVDGLCLRVPAIAIETVGAGGGSIARIDAGGMIAVGPASAGADPGPACYGKGGVAPTVTDAQVAAGVLRPGHFLGGRMTLDAEAARMALARLGQDPQQAADAVIRLVNSNMASALRLVSTARGVDPRGYTLVAYGGGGPLHGAMVADEVGISRVLVPWSPGLTSAFGLIVAKASLDIVQTRIGRLDDASLDETRFAAMANAASAAAAERGFDLARTRIRVGLDLRHTGQAFELTIWQDGATTATALREAFFAAHRTRYGYARPSLPVEVVNYRVQALEDAEALTMPPPAPPMADRPVRRTVRMGGLALEALFLSRSAMAIGVPLVGPAVIEEPTATTVVPPGWSAVTLPTGDLLLEKACP